MHFTIINVFQVQTYLPILLENTMKAIRVIVDHFGRWHDLGNGNGNGNGNGSGFAVACAKSELDIYKWANN